LEPDRTTILPEAAGKPAAFDFASDFRSPPGSLRACARGGLVARTGRPRLPFPADSLYCPGHAAV